MIEILKGAYDLHVHSAPDVVKRRFSDIELAHRFVAAGMKGYAIKSHQSSTAGRAALIREMVPECNAVGTITLNNAVGGLNPMAVEMAARMGAKIVWFPTVDSWNEYDFLNRNTDIPQPYGAVADSKTLKRERISILEDGRLKPVVFDLLDVIKAHNLVLATGHLSTKESQQLIREAARIGVQKMVVTHGDYPATSRPLEIQRECVACGAFIEHNYLQISTGESNWETAISQIRQIGAKHTLICSDGGQTTSIPPDEAIETYCSKLLENGFSESDVRDIFVSNPRLLVE